MNHSLTPIEHLKVLCVAYGTQDVEGYFLSLLMNLQSKDVKFPSVYMLEVQNKSFLLQLECEKLNRILY